MHQSNDCHTLNKGLTLSVIMLAALILAAIGFFNEIKSIKNDDFRSFPEYKLHSLGDKQKSI